MKGFTSVLLIFSAILFFSCSQEKAAHPSEQLPETFKSKYNLKDPEDIKTLWKYDAYFEGFHKESEVFIFNDSVPLRTSPSFDSDTVVLLRRNAAVLVIKNLSEEADGSVTDKWYEVESDEGNGFVEFNDLAVLRLPLNADEKIYFMMGLSGVSGGRKTGKGYVLSESEVLEQFELNDIETSEEGYFHSYISGAVCENPGFTDNKYLVRLAYGYEACGYEENIRILFWDGKEMYKGHFYRNMGGHYDFVRSYVFYPKDSGGLQDRVVVKELSGKAIDEATDTWEEEKKEIIYTWSPGKGIR